VQSAREQGWYWRASNSRLTEKVLEADQIRSERSSNTEILINFVKGVSALASEVIFYPCWASMNFDRIRVKQNFKPIKYI
jgi:hypothetical protein